MAKDELLPVVQDDREAAAVLIEWQQQATAQWFQGGAPAWSFFAAGMPNSTREGIWDNHEVVQAFAAHRLRYTKQPCDHADWSFEKHGRCCHSCGAFVVDFGD